MKQYALLALSFLALTPLLGRAEHADIDLRITAVNRAHQDGGEAHSSADQEPPAGGLIARPLFKAKVNEPLVLQFFLTNTYPHGELKNVTVRYYVVREETARQKTVPDRKAGTVTEGSFVCNLKLKARVGARVRFVIREPGIYLLRVETANTNSDHEHFSALDIQAE
jgi:hypothetical protein